MMAARKRSWVDLESEVACTLSCGLQKSAHLLAVEIKDLVWYAFKSLPETFRNGFLPFALHEIS